MTSTDLLPVTDDEATISWETAVANPEQYTLSFYWETRQDSRYYGGPIVERLPLSAAGTYAWNLDSLPGVGTGSPIFVYAQLENGTARVISECGDVPYSANPETACSTMNHPDLGLAGERILVGTIIYEDVVAPAAPALINVRAEGETSVMVRWEPNGERDLAGYLVTCEQPGLTRLARQMPHYPGSSPLPEAVQVNGLDAGVTALCFVQAYDATGNLSAASMGDTAVPTGDVPLPPAAPVSVGVPSQGIGSITLSWDSGDDPDGFLVFYELVSAPSGQRAMGQQAVNVPLASPVGGFQASEGPSPLDAGDGDSFTLTGLPDGAAYNLWVKAYDAEGRTSPASEVVTVQVGAGGTIYLPLVVRNP